MYKKPKYDLERLKDKAIRYQYELELNNRFEIFDDTIVNEEESIEDKWTNFVKVIHTTAKETVGMKNRDERNNWFEGECRHLDKLLKLGSKLNLNGNKIRPTWKRS